MFMVDQLDCYRGQTRVLENVNFVLNPGGCLLLRGPNGSGKTTLLRTLAGLSPSPNGRISADSEDIVYAGHLDAVKPQLSVAENLRFWSGIYRSDAPDTLDLFNLSDLADRPAATLSAGQKRRLGLARLHISGRRIWLLDEPTTALDADHVARFAARVKEHCANGGMSVISTHLELPIPTAETLDVSHFAAAADRSADPFLDGFS